MSQTLHQQLNEMSDFELRNLLNDQISDDFLSTQYSYRDWSATNVVIGDIKAQNLEVARFAQILVETNP
jgi:hypothetical protein